METKEPDLFQLCQGQLSVITAVNSLLTSKHKIISTVFPRINAAAFIKFFMIWVRRLFEGGVYWRAAFIRGRRLFKMMFILLNNQP